MYALRARLQGKAGRTLQELPLKSICCSDPTHKLKSYSAEGKLKISGRGENFGLCKVYPNIVECMPEPVRDWEDRASGLSDLPARARERDAAHLRSASSVDGHMDRRSISRSACTELHSLVSG